MNRYFQAARRSLGFVAISIAIVSVASASITFFNYPDIPFPGAATDLVEPTEPIPLQLNELLIEGYVLNANTGRPIEWAAVFPGASNRIAEPIPSALAITDNNGFFSIIIDREPYTHLVAACLLPRGKKNTKTATSLVVLPRAEISQAERTFRLKISRRLNRCMFPIEQLGRNGIIRTQ